MPVPLSGARGWAAHAGLSRQFEPLDPCSAASAAKATATNACMQPKPRPRHAPGIPITGYLSSPVIKPAKYSFVAPTRALQRARRSSRHTFDGLLLRLLGLADLLLSVEQLDIRDSVRGGCTTLKHNR